ncbi:hypothetical protein OS493_001861 [Desmophyllum pertusum]|uniref:Uncharacterized protein n=1 Tax=Desmophyllum pertusum TaxID=174260 RepID=A0A9W9Z4G0_9CNID|nr:hypothetical protein OS493_001861 [Desmophyllum pertusum]
MERKKCFEEVDPELQYHLLTSFNNVKTKEQQDQYLTGMIVASDPTWVGDRKKGGKFHEANKGRKQTTYTYYIPTESNRRIVVCKEAFMSIHGIGSAWLKRIRSTSPQSRQGRHRNRPNKITAATIQ